MDLAGNRAMPGCRSALAGGAEAAGKTAAALPRGTGTAVM